MLPDQVAEEVCEADGLAQLHLLQDLMQVPSNRYYETIGCLIKRFFQINFMKLLGATIVFYISSASCLYELQRRRVQFQHCAKGWQSLIWTPCILHSIKPFFSNYITVNIVDGKKGIFKKITIKCNPSKLKTFMNLTVYPQHRDFI